MVQCGGRAQGGGDGTGGSVHYGQLVEEAAWLTTSSSPMLGTGMNRTGRCLPLPSTFIFVLFRCPFCARFRI
jgi:hypothetical protein